MEKVKTVRMNVHKEDWEDKPRAEYLVRLMENNLRSAIFDEIMNGGTKIITVSEMQASKNDFGMVDLKRFINIEEVVRCSECRYFPGNGRECYWGMFAYEKGFCSYGDRRENNGQETN